MPKASLTLENGTIVIIEGSTPEIHELLAFYGSSKTDGGHKASALAIPKSPMKAEGKNEDEVDLMAIVNYVKSCDEAENIETKILDHANQLARVLLPMYMVYEHMNNTHGLTSGQISKVTVQLGVPVKLANVSKTLSGAALKYVVGDTVRKNGQAVKYRLSRRGHAHLKEVITGRKNV